MFPEMLTGMEEIDDLDGAGEVLVSDCSISIRLRRQ